MLLSLVVIFYPIYSVIKNQSSDLHVATTLGRPEHFCSRFIILLRRAGVQMLNLKQQIQPCEPCSRVVVELNGIEPLTPCLQSRCSPN
jgi:hypothetical protein